MLELSVLEVLELSVLEVRLQLELERSVIEGQAHARMPEVWKIAQSSECLTGRFVPKWIRMCAYICIRMSYSITEDGRLSLFCVSSPAPRMLHES